MNPLVAFFRRLCFVLSLGLIVFGSLLALMLQTAPSVTPTKPDPRRYVATTRSLLHHNAQTHAGPQTLRVIALTADDLTAVANFALLRKKLSGQALAHIHGSRLDFAASIRLPVRLAELYINLKLVADDAYPQARISRFKLGRISLPESMVLGLLRLIGHATPLGRYGEVGRKLLQEVRIGGDRLRITLNWDQNTMAQASALFTDVASHERLLVYHQYLAEVLASVGDRRYVNLGTLTQALFRLAHERSQGPEHNDPTEENRALILVLSAYANGRDVLYATGMSATLQRLPQRGVLLHRRIDIAQHFMGSAALAISGYRALADVVGLAKEINDTHSGSGFSFTDLAADRAGARFGRFAALSDDEARRTQRMLMQSADESVFMPSIRDLPENLGPAEFAARFGDTNSADFLALKELIEARIAACQLYQGS